MVLGIISSLLIIVSSTLQFIKKGKPPQRNPSILNKLPMHSLATATSQQRLPVAAAPQPPNRHVTIEASVTPRTQSLSWKQREDHRRRRRRSDSSDDSRSSRNLRRKEKILEAIGSRKPQQSRGGSLRKKEYV